MQEQDINHPSKIADEIVNIDIADNDDELNNAISNIDVKILGDVILLLSDAYAKKILMFINDNDLQIAISELETDDKTDILQLLEKIDEDKYTKVINKLDTKDKEDVEYLKKYHQNQAGSFMQTELFDGFFYEDIKALKEKLKIRKNENILENVHNLFIKDSKGALIGSIPLDDLFICDVDSTLEDILTNAKDKYKPLFVRANEDIEVVIKMFADYDLSALPVVGYQNILIGRITADDIHDITQDYATKQLYNLAGAGENTEYSDSFFDTLKSRSSWLFINLLTAILASMVVAFFADTIEQIVALAILMPIVASMGGNAGTQTLTVLVRQIALSEVKIKNYSLVIRKEFFISLFNGVFFAIITGLITYLWFDNIKLGLIISVAMVINLLTAGFFGAYIPIFLKNLKIDPAIGSTVILTTITDVIGFFAFLMLAKMFY